MHTPESTHARMDRFTARLARSMNMCGQPVAAVQRPERKIWAEIQRQKAEFETRLARFNKNLEETATLIRAVHQKASDLTAMLSKPFPCVLETPRKTTLRAAAEAR